MAEKTENVPSEQPPRKQYSQSVKDAVAGAKKWAEEKRRQGWTKADFAASLKRMFESDTGDVDDFQTKMGKLCDAARRDDDEAERRKNNMA